MFKAKIMALRAFNHPKICSNRIIFHRTGISYLNDSTQSFSFFVFPVFCLDHRDNKVGFGN